MKTPKFNFSASVDERTGRVMAVYFYLRQGVTEETREIVEGKAFADYDAGGELLGVELLAPCDLATLERAVEREPDGIRQFMRRVAPPEMLVA
jgi:uncharacterized protein YuzE